MLPIELPGKIVCVGLNYRDHAEEQGAELPQAPLLFAKWTTSLIGPGEPIVIPPLVTQADYEAELGVVIGRARTRRVEGERLRGRARLPLRERRECTGSPVRGRAVDSREVAGHVLPGRADDPARRDPRSARARIRAIVSGEVLQDSTTANLIFGVDDVIAYASQTTDPRAGRPHPHGHTGGRRGLPRPAAAAAAG